MHVTLSVILMVFAFVLLAIAAAFPSGHPVWPRTVAAGLAFWAASELAGGLS